MTYADDIINRDLELKTTGDSQKQPRGTQEQHLVDARGRTSLAKETG